ncbi:MAG: N-6 DNA methylase [Sedimentisphaerales bacterium]|nr:N-6 DNA methylase [Sedimentisphaerales bacterium]
MATLSVASDKLTKDFNLTRVSAPDFFRSVEDIETYAGCHPYSHFMRRAWETMHLNGILCIDGRPTVYFKEVECFGTRKQRELYQKFWNQGLATLLVLRSPNEVQIFSSLAEPVNKDLPVEDEHRLVETLTLTSEILNFVRRAQTGQIYRDFPKSFQPEKAVDKFLLKNLRNARDLLHAHNELDYKVVHALLGRIIFTCYLVEREIIDEEHFNEAGANGAKTLHDLFRYYHGNKARDILYKLFAVLQRHFNGSMFDDSLEDERPQIGEGHIEILQRFLKGDELDTGQLTFDFWAYDFSVIPVETISAIYENFLSAEDGQLQRRSGAYYTPKHLAEMVVDLAVEGWDLLEKKFLDPACGSGIFLVILFNRIAEEWRRKNQRVHNMTRAEALLEIIHKQLCGIDVNETACRIACFSLYLAFLDQLKPREIRELERKRGKVLDDFLALKSSSHANEETPVIFKGDFFDEKLPVEKSFDLVIGNPPWVSRGRVSDTKALQWCLSENNPYLAEAPSSKNDRERYFLPAKQIAHAFMWKSPVHLKSGGRACLVLPTKVLFNNKTDKFQAGWFSTVSVDKVIQLSDWRKILFENAICPAVIIRFGSQKPEDDYSINYEVPKVSCDDPRRGVIRILPEDRKTIQLSEIQESAMADGISVVWKKRFWGTHRDILLLDRLLEMPRLGSVIGDTKKSGIFISHQGFQPYLPEYYEEVNGKRRPIIEKHGKPKPIWWSKSHLYVDANTKDMGLILTKKDCCEFGQYRFRKLFTELRRSPEDRAIFEPPLVLVTKGFSRKMFSPFPVVFNNTFQSISGKAADANVLMFLAAVLNTNLADYCLFHISASLGVERDQIYLNEIELLPFPLPERTQEPQRSRLIIDDIAKQMCDLKASIEKEPIGQDEKVRAATQEIEPLVHEYYGISSHEQMLIEDTVNIFKRSMTPASTTKSVQTLEEPTSDERKYYVELLCGTLNMWAKRSSFKVNGKIEFSDRLGTSVITLWKSRKIEQFKEERTSDHLQAVLGDVQQALPRRMRGFTYYRNLKVFDGNKLYLLKPLARRHWTKTAAINDADEIAAAILSSGRSG